MKKSKIVGIAGGSGSGKSSLTVKLYKKYEDKCSLVSLDDYFVPKEQAPLLSGFINWDHPGALRFDDLYHDLTELLAGRPIVVKTKHELYNPEYNHSDKNYKIQTIEPAELILVEGYLLFWDQRIRDLLDFKIFLKISTEECLKRRSGNKFIPVSGYVENVLVPMHEEFVFPTRDYSDLCINTALYDEFKTEAIVTSHVNELTFHQTLD